MEKIKELTLSDKRLIEHLNNCSQCRNKMLSIMLHAGCDTQTEEVTQCSKR